MGNLCSSLSFDGYFWEETVIYFLLERERGKKPYTDTPQNMVNNALLVYFQVSYKFLLQISYKILLLAQL